ncbi:MAG: radical SAM protein [Planctomycetaceae bacterium]|nr:radical SAM protein [Planctomycetaceae bacterium]
MAFHRDQGDLVELDVDGFDAVAALAKAQTLPDLRGFLRAQGHPARRPELAAFVGALEARGVVLRVAHDAPDLPPDSWGEGAAPEIDTGLRAPIVAHWAVTYRCNLRCAYCYAESGPWREVGPGPAVRRRIVERLAAWGVLEVALGGGEPTLLPDFAALLAAIRAAGLVANVTTNGTNHRPEVIRALAEHAGVVHLSADRPEHLDAARGVGVFARLRQTASDLAGTGARLGVNLLLTPDNVRDLRRSLDEAVGLGARGVTLLCPKGDWASAHWPGFPGPRDLEAVAEGVHSFTADRPPVRLYVDTALRGEWAELGLLDDPEPEVVGCGGGQRHVAVTPEGDVYPCSHARCSVYRMGNLLTDGRDHLWSRGTGLAARLCYVQDCHGVRCACRTP